MWAASTGPTPKMAQSARRRGSMRASWHVTVEQLDLLVDRADDREHRLDARARGRGQGERGCPALTGDGQQPAAQNPAPVTVTGSTAVPKGDIKNGNVTMPTMTNPPVTPIEGAPDCPGSSWTESITDMAFTSATITLFQDSNENGTFEAGELVLTVNCTFNPPTSNGVVPESGFTCTVS
jgi:hypothetical protein